MTASLEAWAVEKARILILECEPVLKGIYNSSKQKEVSAENNFTGELDANELFIEGAVCRVVVDRYERDLKARKACLNRFGYSCDVCRMNFVERYGEIGDGFIHVHHRNPLAIRKAEYVLDPVTDLVPVCPNCHAMLHTKDPPMGTDELRKIIEEKGKL